MSQTGVFICPSCQSVVRSEKLPGEGLVCGECGHDFGEQRISKAAPTTAVAGAKAISQAPRGTPAPKSGAVARDVIKRRVPLVGQPLDAKPLDLAAINTAEVAVSEVSENGDEEIIMPDGTRKVRRRKRRRKQERYRGMLIFLAGWIAVIAVIFFLFKDGESQAKDEVVVDDVDSTEQANRLFLRKQLPEVKTAFIDFMKQPTNDGREQFIANAPAMARHFANHYLRHGFPRPETAIHTVEANVITLSEDPLKLGIETIWADEDNNQMGAVHLYQQGWKLDWECFAPYSQINWSRFLLGEFEEEGTFRLLVRKRRSEDDAKRMLLSFYRAPEFFEKEGQFKKTESPEVSVPLNSKIAKEFLALWEARENGEAPYGSILERLDPEGYLRITVTLGWRKGEFEEKILTLQDIVGVGWYGGEIQTLYHEAEKKKKEAENETENELSAIIR